jgi:hypothetical protein
VIEASLNDFGSVSIEDADPEEGVPVVVEM